MPLATVVIYDIRGFSTAARRIPEAAFGAFITEGHRAILGLLAEPAPIFVKNLGDGSLLIWDGDSDDQLARIVDGCLLAQREYRALVARQSFDGCEHLPRDVGFGIAAGTITRGDDYYGQAINLAARLQDCARPRGVVMDEALHRRLPRHAEPVTFVRTALKGVGKVRYAWIARLTRRERWRRHAARASRMVLPVVAPLALFAWIDGGLPFPAGTALRGAIDSADVSLLRRHDDEVSLRTRAAALRARLVAEIATRFDETTGRALPGPGLAPDFFPWTDAETLAALAAGDLPAGAAARVQRDLDALFAGRTLHDGTRLDEFIEGRGFIRHPTEPTAHFESTAYALVALVLLHAHPELAGPTLDERTARVWRATRAAYDPACRGWHWRLDQAASNFEGEPELENQHFVSTYNTLLAIWALVEARRLNVALDDRDAILAASTDWLIRHFHEDAGGWGAVFYPSDDKLLPNGTEVYSDALTLQAFALLALVERFAPEALPGGVLPPAIRRALHEHVIALSDRPLTWPLSRQKWVVNVMEAGHPRRMRDMIDFFWLPWAWLVADLDVETAPSRRERVEALRALTHLTALVATQIGSDVSANDIYQADEIGIALGLGGM